MMKIVASQATVRTQTAFAGCKGEHRKQRHTAKRIVEHDLVGIAVHRPRHPFRILPFASRPALIEVSSITDSLKTNPPSCSRLSFGVQHPGTEGVSARIVLSAARMVRSNRTESPAECRGQKRILTPASNASETDGERVPPISMSRAPV